MDPKLCYEYNKNIYAEVPEANISEDENLSDDHIIEELDGASSSDSEDDVPLSELRERMKNNKSTPQWKKSNLSGLENNIKFSGNIDLSEDVTNLVTPFQHFKYFFTDEILEDIVQQSKEELQ